MIGLAVLAFTAERRTTWDSRWTDYVKRITDTSYDGDFQTEQSHMAIAAGGLSGTGVGKSAARNFLPNANADFVYAIIVEEYGLIGGIVMMGFYLLILFRSVSIITVSKTFGALLAAGLSFLLVLQAMMHMGVTVGLLPNTGLTLPFVSTGGTSILLSAVTVGIILSVSRVSMTRSLQTKTA